MTTTLRKIARIMTVMLVPALVVLVPTKALANPNFGNRDFQEHLRQDSGLFGGSDARRYVHYRRPGGRPHVYGRSQVPRRKAR